MATTDSNRARKIAIVQSSQDWLLSRARKLCVGLGNAEDLLQEAQDLFLREFPRRPAQELKTSITERTERLEGSQWLVVTLGHVVVDYARRRRAEVLGEPYLAERQEYRSMPGRFFLDLTNGQLSAFLDQLGHVLKEVLVSNLRGRSYAEIAESHGIAKADVAKCLLDARRRLGRVVMPALSNADWDWTTASPCRTLDWFVDGELVAVEAVNFSNHLARCERCQRGLRILLQLDGLWACLADRFLEWPEPERLHMRSPDAGGWLNRKIWVIRAQWRSWRRSRIRKAQVHRDELQAVHLGASAPRSVQPGKRFKLRFGAYRWTLARGAKRRLRAAGSRAVTHLDHATGRWQVGTAVTVRLSGEYLDSPPVSQNFVWEGHEHYLDFEVQVGETSPSCETRLNVDIIVDGFLLARLRLALSIRRVKKRLLPGRTTFAFTAAPQTAFASYAAEDRSRVLDRIAAIRIAIGLDIFMDCYSINPNEKWRDRLENEIAVRDLFMLFWSDRAAQSSWVEWEWRYALKRKGLSAFQAHPLDPWPEIPLPPELAEIHFGDPLMAVRAAFVLSDAHDKAER